MQTIIYYFTGTGNSLWLAKRLARQLPDASVISIIRALRQPQQSVIAERIGLVFPVYYCGMPSIVTEFLRRVDLSRSEYRFAVLNSGGMFGRAMTYLCNALHQSGCDLHAGYKVKMPSNFILGRGLTEAQVHRKLQNVNEVMEHITQRVRAGERGIDHDGKVLRTLSPLLYNWWLKRSHLRDARYIVDETCNGCEMCKEVCPVGNITIHDGRPVWHHACEQCLACLHLCPREAIQYGARTRGRRRYRHPDISVREIISNNMIQ